MIYHFMCFRQLRNLQFIQHLIQNRFRKCIFPAFILLTPSVIGLFQIDYLHFCTIINKQINQLGTSDGRTLCAGGLAAFALCLCWELPTVLQTLVQEGGGALLTPTLLFRLGLCCVGALGALSAVRCTRTEQDV